MTEALATPKKIIPQVVRDDVPKIIIPEGLRLRDAATFCTAKAEEEEAIVPFSRNFQCLPWAGGYALQSVLMRDYSATAQACSEMEVPGRGGIAKIRWGTWAIAGLGTVSENAAGGTHGVFFNVVVKARRMDEDKVHVLFEKLQAEVDKRAMYGGCAILLEPDAEGNLYLATPPKIVKVEKPDKSKLILSRMLFSCVEAELFQVITDCDAVLAAGIPVKRGVLLTGKPGTGKTMTARIAAGLAIENGWAVFYLPDARAIEAALAIAKMYSPALLICEDLDRQLSGPRNALTDRILNALDGLDKSTPIVFVATTNDPSGLPAPLLRPGRLDSFMVFDPPDAEASERLLRLYLADRAPEGAEGQFGKYCQGLLPASIREVASRSVLHAMSRGDRIPLVEDIQASAMTVRQQQRLLEAAERAPKNSMPAVGVHLFRGENGHEELPEGTEEIGAASAGALLQAAWNQAPEDSLD